MGLCILQNDLTDPSSEQLVAAFTALDGLTAMDARRRATDACGILAGNLDEDDAAALLSALAAQGVPAAIVDEQDLGTLPTPYRVREVDAGDDQELIVFDAHNSFHRVQWPAITLIAAGLVGRTDIHTEVSTRLERVALTGLSHVVQERRTTESRAMRPFIEFYMDAPPHRVRIEADNFRFTYLGPQAPRGLVERYERLVLDLAGRAPAAQINRGADAIIRDAPRRAYRSIHVFEREILWLRWMTRSTKGNHR